MKTPRLAGRTTAIEVISNASVNTTTHIAANGAYLGIRNLIF